MEKNEEILKIISNETIDSIHDMNIVTPTIYKSIFTKFASSHGAALEQEDQLTESLLDEKISLLQNLQTKTTQNAVELSDHTSRAISAIKEKDESTLNKVLKETQKLRHEIEKLKEAVYKDELTHAKNRKWLHDNFLEENSENFKDTGTLAIIDLNYFKIVNDTFGHVVGDKVLIFIANQLKQTRESVVRYGGDEFIIIFSSRVNKDTALGKLNKIRETIIQKKLKANKSSFKVSFSFGVHEFKKGDTLSSVIEGADKNMYSDKIQIKKQITGI